MTVHKRIGSPRALLLEDDVLRGRALQRELKGKGYEVTWAHNFEEAADALATSGTFDFATLDHDLGEEHTGYDVVKFILSMSPRLRPSKIDVHSSNVIGAANMIEALKAEGVSATRRQW